MLIIDATVATFFLLVGINYSTRLIGLHQRDGKDRIFYGEVGSSTWLIRWTFNLFRAAIASLLILRLFFESVDTHVIFTFTLPGEAVIRWLGVFLLLVSGGLISYLHAFMGKSWSSGINNDFTLVDTGPYARSRNPMFLAIMLGMLGLTLSIPSAFTLLSLVVGVIAITRQAVEEEKKLMHIPSYISYMRRTPRWL